LLFNAFEIDGIDNFYIELLEDNVPNNKLSERENFWIHKLDSLNTEFGLNMRPGAASAVGYGTSMKYMGKYFPSLQSAVRTYQKLRSDCPKHVIEKRIKANKPLPISPRHHSKHPEAGSPYWRRWKGLVKHDNICSEWAILEDDKGYENFKRDMGFPPNNEYKLGRLDITKPHSKDNSRWMTSQEEREIFSGVEITAFGICYPSYSALANEYGIKLTTLLYRLSKGLSPEEAVNPHTKTSPKVTKYDGIEFKSKSEMLNYAAKKYNITVGQAKDRYARGLPFDHVPFKSNSCIINGKEFPSEKDAIEFYSISSSSYNKCKAKGMSPEDAINHLLKRKSKQFQLLL